MAFAIPVRLDPKQLSAIVGALRGEPACQDRLVLIRVTDHETGLTLEGDFTLMKISDTQQVTLEFGAPVDKKGRPAKVQDGSVVWSVSDDHATVEVDPANPLKATVKGISPHGDGEAGVVKITADADLGDGVKEISGTEPLIVTTGEAVGFGPPTVGTPEEQPAP